MDIINDWSLFWPFMIKAIILCFLMPSVGYLISAKWGYHEPEDDKEGYEE